MNKYDVVILGSGPAGLTAAIYASRGGLSSLVLTGDQPGGQPTLTTKVENYPGFSQGIDGRELMTRVQKQAKRFDAEIQLDMALKLEKTQSGFRITGRQNKYLAQSVIIAVGANPRWLKVKGGDKFRGKGVSVCATCDGPLFKDKVVAVVGGGDTALVEAGYLAKLAKHVFILHRRENYRAEAYLQKRTSKLNNLTPLFNTQVMEFLGKDRLTQLKLDSRFKVESDRLADEVASYADKYGEEIIEKTDQRLIWQLSVDGVFIAIGYQPNTDFLKNFLKLDKKGYILTKNEVFTSVNGVFAAGDCVDWRYRQTVIAAGMGAKAAMEVEEWLRNKQ
jgi:thioredoxin reductase (NADPH)